MRDGVATEAPAPLTDRPDEARRAARRQGWALAALLGALFLGNVDVAVANIAGPSIRDGLHASGGELELVVSGYTLPYAAFLVTSARLGEARGYRRMFLLGLAGFTLALYLQQGLGKSAVYSGLALLPWVAAFGIPGPALGRLPARLRELAGPAGAVILAAGFGGVAASLYAGDTSGVLLMTLLGVAGLGLGTTFAGMLSHLTGSVTSEHAASISGLFNTTTRVGGVIGTAAFGTVYLALAPAQERAVHGFATLNLMLAATALAAASLAGLSIRRRHGEGRP